VKEPQKLQCRFTKYSIGLDKEKYVCGYWVSSSTGNY
jgi:hypothetical protein